MNSVADDREERLSPGVARELHQELDQYRHQELHDLRAIPDLGAVHGTVPGGPAMHQLVSEHIQPVKELAQDGPGVGAAEGLQYLPVFPG